MISRQSYCYKSKVSYKHKNQPRFNNFNKSIASIKHADRTVFLEENELGFVFSVISLVVSGKLAESSKYLLCCHNNRLFCRLAGYTLLGHTFPQLLERNLAEVVLMT